MPRLSVCLNRDDPKQNFENENIDICKKCWPHIELEDIREEVPGKDVTDEQIQTDIDQADDGSDHPPYSDCDYDCAVCGVPLTDEDN
jgi:hypothetical protein